MPDRPCAGGDRVSAQPAEPMFAALAHQRALEHIADAWRALRLIPGYPHVRTAERNGTASLAINIEHLAADLAQARAGGVEVRQLAEQLGRLTLTLLRALDSSSSAAPCCDLHNVETPCRAEDVCCARCPAASWRSA